MIHADRNKPGFALAPLVLASECHGIVEGTLRVGEAKAVLQHVGFRFRWILDSLPICTVCIFGARVKSRRPNQNTELCGSAEAVSQAFAAECAGPAACARPLVEGILRLPDRVDSQNLGTPA